MIAIPTLMWISSIYTTSELAAFKYGFLKWMIPVILVYPIALLFVTGHGYFDSYLPASCVNFLNTHNVDSLQTMLFWMVGNYVLRITCCGIAMLRRN